MFKRELNNHKLFDSLAFYEILLETNKKKQKFIQEFEIDRTIFSIHINDHMILCVFLSFTQIKWKLMIFKLNKMFYFSLCLIRSSIGYFHCDNMWFICVCVRSQLIVCHRTNDLAAM